MGQKWGWTSQEPGVRACRRGCRHGTQGPAALPLYVRCRPSPYHMWHMRPFLRFTCLCHSSIRRSLSPAAPCRRHG